MTTRGSFLVIVFTWIMGILASVAGASAAPILPMFEGHVFDFGASNTNGVVEYQTNGINEDTISFTRNFSIDNEVTIYSPAGPGGPLFPVWGDFGSPNFGGDFVMDLFLSNTDTVGGNIDVSLTGINGTLEIYGSLGSGMGELLWELDLDNVALYGNSASSTFVLEAEGLIVGGLIPNSNPGILVNTDRGAIRGFLEFDMPWLTDMYHPSDNITDEIDATYSGQTGLLPEPGTLGFLLCGLVGLLIRRKRTVTRPA